MNKSILVLDDNSVIHGLITSALELEGLTIHHEFNPGKFVERANSLMPDLILLGNIEQDPDHSICRNIKTDPELEKIPLVVMAGSKVALSDETIRELGIDGMIRKPFEASDLQQQVSKHLNLSDLIGSAYEFRQSQGAPKEKPNPLADLDVLDDEVTSLLHDTESPAAAGHTPPEQMLDEETLSQELQPEQAFEPLDEEPAEAAQAQVEDLEELGAEDILEEETLQAGLDEEGEPPLEELDAGDILDEEPPEEVVFSPQAIDKDLDEPAEGSVPSLEEIEVELDGEEDLEYIDSDLSEEPVEFEPEDAAPEPTAREVEENIPQSVRRMMDMKPVFELSDEEKEDLRKGGTSEEISFEPTEEQEHEMLTEVEPIETIDLTSTGFDDEPLDAETIEIKEPEPEEITATPSEPAIEIPPEMTEKELFGGEDASEFEGLEEMAEEPLAADQDSDAFYRDEFLGDEELDEDEVLLAAQDEQETEEYPSAEFGDEDRQAAESLDLEEETLDTMPEEEPLSEEPDEVVELTEMDESAADLASVEEVVDEEIEELAIDEDEEEMIASSVAREAEMGAPPEESMVERNFKSLDEDGEVWATVSEQDQAGEAEGASWEQVPDQELDFEPLETAPQEEEEMLAPLEEFGTEEISLETHEQAEGVSLSFDEQAQGEEEEISVSFGADEELPGFEPEAGDEEGESWKPSEPPGFVAKISEEFPEEVAKEPPSGPAWEPGEASEVPRHVEEEVLETPEELEFLDDDQQPWKPTAPPGFVSQPSEDFPEEATDEPFTGPQTAGGEPTDRPRYQQDEVLVDPISLEPVLEGGEELPEEPLAEEPDDSLQMFAEPEPVEELPELSPDEQMEDDFADLTETSAEIQAVEEEDDDDDDLSFDEAFASVRAEIESNPEGEKLEDVLRLEEIKERVSRLVLTIPDDAGTFSRAIALFSTSGGEQGEPSAYPDALKGSGPVGEPGSLPVLKDVAQGAGQELAQTPDGALSLLDEDTRSKLGSVLDEIISISVRKAVQEEMPRLVERLVKEEKLHQ
ncbi:MAG: hypothetical protein OEZ59_06590 [Deltaproteobacteria bacterium]|nr:hypothetical protein [Deltaproteobacteria bacterium]